VSQAALNDFDVLSSLDEERRVAVPQVMEVQANETSFSKGRLQTAALWIAAVSVAVLALFSTLKLKRRCPIGE
jgi:hypothetical protein